MLSHTVSGQAWQNLSFNGTLVGETGINAALCGHWGVPVVLVTGDRAVCKEARELLGDGADDGRGEGGARPLQRAFEDAGAGARADRGRRAECAVRSLRRRSRTTPVARARSRSSSRRPTARSSIANRKGVEVTGSKSLVVRGDDWWSAWSGFFF